ncbi:hypothetical protein [Rhodococcus chondri]|uniref:Uncharacterized protein n=1 Tax=Rhodococcus chondri TaxID=3065941 RepID=A0ABU7JUC8_9NOCA|nr:hypothetical protein [Rhodococcus sp. CC-R104]MEE2033632.1 hypothetical protein [Rhodococcus sp. CC-R104]
MRRWAWVYEELRDLQAADAEDLRRQRDEERAQLAPRPALEAIPAPADEVVDLGLMHYEDAVVEVRRTTPPPRRVRRRNHRT